MIAYYVHHHGLGHLARARCIAAVLDEPVIVLSSLPAPSGVAPFAGWVTLPRDDEDPERSDVEAGGALHWSPLSAPGYARRMAILAEWVRTHDPSVVVVDVSVEVAVLVRLLGIPVVVMAGPGERGDEAHQLGYRLATRIVAPWTREVYDPAHLHSHAAKIAYVGAISRFDTQPKFPPPGERRVLVLFGAGGSQADQGDLAAARAATPAWKWHGCGGHLPWTDDVWENLQASDVVVTHAGQNAIAEVAAAGRPALVVPQPRPFQEQAATATALDAAGIATAVKNWPCASAWPGLLTAAQATGGRHWRRWSAGDGASRAAAAIRAAAGDA